MVLDPEVITLPLAVLGGLVSFLSPCVLPLVPAYIGYLTGQATNTVSSTLAVAGSGAEGGSATVTAQPSRWIVLLHGIFFVLGFSVIFVLVFGFTVGLLGQLALGVIQSGEWLVRIGGLLIIVLGLHTMGVIRIPFLYYDTRKQSAPRQEWGYFGSFLMGITFAAGWSPCLGPILSALIGLSASTGSALRSTVLLSAYALGLGIPFLLTALLLDRATGSLHKLRKHMRVIEIVSGVLLIVIGVLMLSGGVQRLSAQFARFTDLAITLDEWLVTLVGSGQ
jgi:cytochrome c-type biogenesis protein